MKSGSRAYLYGLVAVMLWSTVASAFKVTLRHLSVVELLLYSSAFSTIILAAILAATGKLPETLRCTRRQYLRSALLGFLNPYVYYLVLFKAYELLPAQEAQALNYTWALTLAILAVPLLKQRIGARDFVGLAVGYVGVVIVSTHGDVLGFRVSDPLGVALALGSTVIWALYWIYSTKDERHPLVCLFLSFAMGLAFVALHYFITQTPSVPSVAGLLGAAYIGAFEMSLTFVAWLTALRLSANAARMGSLIFISPFASLFFIRHVVGEDIRASTIVGLAFIVMGLVVQRSKPSSARRAR